MSMPTLLADARAIDHPNTRNSGIGRHVTSLLRGLADHDVPVIALYGSDDERSKLAEAAPGLTLKRWAPSVIREHARPGTWYLATQLMLDPVSLDPVPAAVSECRLPVAALMYDVIPYRYPDIFLVDDAPRLQSVLRRSLAATVDLMLANSAFVADTAAAELGYPADRITVVGAAPDPMFAPGPRAAVDHLLPTGAESYVIAVTGAPERKNTPMLLRAWGALDPGVRRGRRLVIVGGHSVDVRRAWDQVIAEAGIADDVVIAGRVGDDDLISLLRSAELAVVPATEEGFGLPVVEAAAVGCPVICSDTSSLPEVLDEPTARFDPLDHHAMADVIGRALVDPVTQRKIAEAGLRSIERWTWPRVTDDLVAAIAAATPLVGRSPRPCPLRFAVPAPDDPARLIEVTLDSDTVDDGAVVNGMIVTHAAATSFQPFSIDRYWKPWRYDAIVMHPPRPAELAPYHRIAAHGHVHLVVDLARHGNATPDTAHARSPLDPAAPEATGLDATELDPATPDGPVPDAATHDAPVPDAPALDAATHDAPVLDATVLDAAGSIVVAAADGSEMALAAAEHLAGEFRVITRRPVRVLAEPASASVLVAHVRASGRREV